MNSSLFKMLPTSYSLTNHIYLILKKEDLALDNLQELKCHKTQSNQTRTLIYLTPKWTLIGTSTLSQSEPESNGNEEVLHIPQVSGLEPHH